MDSFLWDGYEPRFSIILLHVDPLLSTNIMMLEIILRPIFI
jgi:hypothetical protein